MHVVCREYGHPGLEALVGLLKCLLFFAAVLFIICSQLEERQKRVQKE